MWIGEPWDTLALSQQDGAQPLAVSGSSDVEAAPSHGSGQRKLFLDSPSWGGSLGDQHCPWQALGSPALCWPQIPLSYLVVGLLSGAACAHVPASLNTDTSLGSPSLALLGSSRKKSCSSAGMMPK